MPDSYAISLRLEVTGTGLAREDPGMAGAEFVLRGPGTPAIAMTVALESDHPVGEVQMGSRRWRFANRVQMLEAIDAACDEAIRGG